MKLLSLTIVFLTAVMTNCQEEIQSSDITKIEFGTSFGMCAGYCTQILTVEKGSISKEVISRNSEKFDLGSVCSEFDDYSNVFKKINLESFISLDNVIGCPDCTDGGAEWIEITTPEGSKRVTYEYGKEPDAVKPFIGELRKYFNQLGECE